MTLIDAVQSAAERLEGAGVAFGHGTTNAFDEAAWLVLWRLSLPLDALDENAGRALTGEEQQAIKALIEQRITTRKPAAYLTGEAWLHGVPFFVDERVIIPRSLIAETLLDGTLDAWLGVHTKHVLDLCTGNASLAVLAAMAWPDVTVDAADISADALAVALKNVKRHQLGDRIALHQGDGLHAVAGRQYDLVLCNPPYVNSTSMAALPAEFCAEPSLALAGGSDGMDFIRPLIFAAPKHLRPQGVLVLEIGHEADHFEAAFPKLPTVWLETSAGETSVLLLTREDLVTFIDQNKNP